MVMEKNKTKAQLKKEATMQRYNFIEAVYELVLRQVFEGTKDNASKLKITIKHQNHNRYIHFSMYAQAMEIKIFTDGNVEMVLEEFCHEKHVEQVFLYDKEPEKQQKFLKHFEVLLLQVILEFLQKGALGWHGFMDFVGWEGNIEKAIATMKEEYPNESEKQ